MPAVMLQIERPVINLFFGGILWTDTEQAADKQGLPIYHTYQ